MKRAEWWTAFGYALTHPAELQIWFYFRCFGWPCRWREYVYAQLSNDKELSRTIDKSKPAGYNTLKKIFYDDYWS